MWFFSKASRVNLLKAFEKMCLRKFIGLLSIMEQLLYQLLNRSSTAWNKNVHNI